MGWLRLVGSFKLQVSFAKEPCKRDNTLQKRPRILRSLLTVATPYATHLYVIMYVYTKICGEYTICATSLCYYMHLHENLWWVYNIQNISMLLCIYKFKFVVNIRYAKYLYAIIYIYTKLCVEYMTCKISLFSIYAYMYICLCVYVYICMYMCMHIYT